MIVDEARRQFPLDTLVQEYWLPAIRAAVALERKEPEDAMRRLGVASAIDLGQPMQLNVVLCPIYIRGQAYLMLHQDDQAIDTLKQAQAALRSADVFSSAGSVACSRLGVTASPPRGWHEPALEPRRRRAERPHPRRVVDQKTRANDRADARVPAQLECAG